MVNAGKTKVVFLWHMHQPDYRDIITGEYYFPWTYLHAIKDYVDMAAHIELQPKAKAVVNFAPILLEQLDDYAEQIQSHLSSHTNIKDAVLASLTDIALPPPGSTAFAGLVEKLLRANRERLIERFPDYRELADIASSFSHQPHLCRYLSEQYLVDLCVWYHLSWTAEIVRRTDSRITRLQDKARGFNMDDRRLLMTVIGELVASVVPRYRKLAENGQVELCMSPYAHPIVPLLIDINSAKEAMPDVTLPNAIHYPDGRNRAKWHLNEGIRSFEHYFGVRPRGCWASEGALSDATLALLHEAKFEWAATGDSVLHNTLRHEQNQAVAQRLQEQHISLHRAYEFAQVPLKTFFRDDGLSDLIGFKYSNWHSDDAVGDLINHMVNIANSANDPANTVISVIMDGENAWEYFPENAYHFLSTLYRSLSDHPQLAMATYAEVLDQQQPIPTEMPHLVAGSWVYGTFSTWIGDRDKNRGWDMLCEAKSHVDNALKTKTFTAERLAQIEKQLALCEGSDWFWWFGDYNPAQSVSDFEYLYRRHLSNLYALIEEPVPAYLAQVISVGGGDPASGGVMRHGHA
ncbi:glycoside hydrolase family 57 protein [Cellvibrio japonicus]|uniref:Glycoside hydrolase, putative, gly57A n=1 Tax=Cellvibrio japonicus (strain Ueda107) TaxID=498211 RepID=B3PGN2_CELJU|nr:glycoside hydrolase family 57 protein [Cellvibrio japonicus]ACE85680.1 glycoside hydrolase, putative, gly57A [Cellvibrio japonicus Ueda107]QEI12378.1 glycoside hydrolase [Cellvibrio japonicus]QEI15951.1 glycoside hydrolase [Cellvibrio japonicus]QEI19530.1 glycoside hydrolase [Cellvibrio japonicus]